MTTALSNIMPVIPIPAFIATESADLIMLNEPMRELLGVKSERDNRYSLISLGLFENVAEFRGFMRGFKSVGPVQRLKLPSTRLKYPSRKIVLQATWLKDQGIVVGTFSINEVDTRTLHKNTDLLASELIDYLPQFLIKTDGKGRIVYMNLASRRVLKAGDDHESNYQDSNLSKVDAEFSIASWRDHLAKARRNDSCVFETHFVRRNDTLLPVQVELFQVNGFPVNSVTLVATDISTRRQLEQRLNATRLEMEDLKYQRERDKAFLSDQYGNKVGIDGIVSGDSSYGRVIEQIDQVANTDSTVLITGETGTGKELVARAIHAASRRTKEPLVIVNCGALPRDLIESELFGYRKGAFTGANRNQVGRFELADQGTLFLDEIGEMPLDLQTRLLRFIQEGEVTPIGSSESIYTDVRIIAATNRNLEEMVRENKFRADLYYRLNVFPIHNPPLRERREDIPLLVSHFIKKHGRRLNTPVERCSPEMLAQLMKYPFPGNIRELENIVERALITSKGKLLVLDWNITAHGLVDPKLISSSAEEPVTKHRAFAPDQDIELTFEEMQKRYIEIALEKSDGKVSGKGGAAEKLDMNPQTLFSKIRKFNINY